MAKTTGLSTRLYVMGTDLSGDVASLDGVGVSQNLLDSTTLDQSANSRLIGLKDSTVSCSAFFDNAAGKGHSVWSSNSGKIPIADQTIMIPLVATIGEPVLCFVSKQGSYNVTRPIGGPIGATVDYSLADGTGPDWGVMLTAGAVTDSSGTTYTAVDNGASSSDGARAQVQCMSLTSGSVTATIQDSADDTTYASLGAFTAITGQTQETISISGTVDRYVRLVTSGTFSTAVISVAFTRL